MIAQIYRSTSPFRATLRAIFAKDTSWTDGRGGQPHENWTLIEQVDLERPARPLPFSADAALESVRSEGAFLYQVAPSDLHLNQHEALNEYRLRFTVPLLSETADGPDILGTGTLFTHEGRFFIVTADHVFRSKPGIAGSPLIDRSMVHVPREPRRVGEPMTGVAMLGRHALHHFTGSPDVDVVVVELLDPAIVADLRNGWEFLPFSQAEDVAETDDRFVITGFMHHGVRYNARRNTLSQQMLNLETDRLHYTPALRTLVPEFDVFLHFQNDGMTVDGVQRSVKTLVGLSGGPIWALREVADGDLWTPSMAMRIVAVQSGQDIQAKTWARGFRWSAVLRILRSAGMGFISPP